MNEATQRKTKSIGRVLVGSELASPYRVLNQAEWAMRKIEQNRGFQIRRTIITRFLRRPSANDSTTQLTLRQLPLRRCRRNSVARNRGRRAVDCLECFDRGRGRRIPPPIGSTGALIYPRPQHRHVYFLNPPC